MTSVYERKAKFEEVVKDIDALKFHAEKFEQGFRYPLAKECYQYVKVNKIA